MRFDSLANRARPGLARRTARVYALSRNTSLFAAENSPVQAQTLVILAALAATLAACAKPPAPVAEAPPALRPHLGPPPAASCSVAPFHVADGGSASVSMTVSSEGGYCAATLVAGSGRPYDAPLVPLLPAHGSARVVKYSGKTSVEYAPVAGYVGADTFTVKLILRGVPGYTTLSVAVMVGSGAAHA